MEAVLAQVHYLPTTWKGQAHTAQVIMASRLQISENYLLPCLGSQRVRPTFPVQGSLPAGRNDIAAGYTLHFMLRIAT
jgi:hypothetical protein